MKQQLYDQIETMLGKVDGVNKDGIFSTIDGKQYHIKIVEKRKPVEFDGVVRETKVDPVKKDLVNFNDAAFIAEVAKIESENEDEIIGMFEGRVDDV